ncbi:MAG: efflux RND transporter periplasmic adaptor subunit [Oscillospiraceae bacterium]|jgi:HlyD family secretion protein|nr:efflux RND transporter periplasmic adaptor subunit [Oscillospiraceae bacterium]
MEQETAAAEVRRAAPEKPKRRRGIKKWIVLAVVAAVLAAAVIAAGQLLRRFGGAVQAYASEYVTDTVGRRDISSSLSGSGTLQPADSYSVTTLIEGEILTADFEEGSTVEKDTVLYEIDSSNTSSGLERAELTLASARNSYERQLENREKLEIKAPVSGYITSLDVETGDSVTAGQTVISIVDSRFMTVELPFLADDAAGFRAGQEAVVTLDGSFEELAGRVTKIGASDVVLTGNVVARYVTVEAENPGALSPSQTATASVGGAQCSGPGAFKYKNEKTVTAELSGDVAAIAVREGEYVEKDRPLITLTSSSLNDSIDNAYRQLRDAEIAMENQTDQLDNYTIKSPIKGTVISKDYKQGDTLSAGKVLCTIYDLSYLQMTMNIDELDIKKIEVGQDVAITADAVEGRAFSGVVTKISIQGTTSNGVTSYPVTVRVDDTGELLPGMNVDAEIVFQSAENVLSVPIGAVVRGDRVLVKKSADAPPSETPADGGNGAAGSGAGAQNIPEGYEYADVETGVSDDSYIEIKSGLEEGDEITYAKQAESQNTFMMTMPGGGMGGAGSFGAAPGGGAPAQRPGGGGAATTFRVG